MNTDDHKDLTGKPAMAETWDVLDLLLLIARRRRLIITLTSFMFFAGVLLSFIIKPKFTAKAVILPPQQQTSSSAFLNQLGSLSSLGGAAALGIKTPADLYIGILQSRTIADALIAAFHLNSGKGQKQMEATRIALRAQTEIESGKDGMIQISVTDTDPKRASDLANAYVDQLYAFNSQLTITEAAQRRAFFDQQLNDERKALAAAEDALRTTQQQTGIIQLEGQAQVVVQTIADLRAAISSREVTMRSLQSSETDQNPDVVRIANEIDTMRQQLARLENDQKRQAQPGDISQPAGRVAENTLEYTRRYREVKYHEALFDLLSRQFEAARIDEAKSAPIIQVIDRALPPEMKSSPRRTLIVLGFLVFGFVLSLAIAVADEALKRAQQIPEHAARLEDLRSQLWRSR